MANKNNISTNELKDWDEFKDKSPEESLPSIYEHIGQISKGMTDWYWISIRAKRKISLAARGAAFLLLLVGTSLPIISALFKDMHDRLVLTQWGIASLAVAGLFTLADRIFGWSSGWMRYISTVTTMENLTRAYELEWASHIVSKTTPLDNSDVKKLFDLSIALEQELTKLQVEETTKWITEFNSGISLLESMIRSQREENDKKLEAIRTNLSNQATSAKEEEKLKESGTIEVSFIYKDKPMDLQIQLDSNQPVSFRGYVWSVLDVSPGQHQLNIEIKSDPPLKISKVVEVQPSTKASVEIKLPI